MKTEIPIYNPVLFPEWEYAGDKNGCFDHKKYDGWVIRHFRHPDNPDVLAIYARRPTLPDSKIN